MSDDTAATPELELLTSTEQREWAQDLLAEAYAEGRVTEAEFDGRLDQVLSARTRRELQMAVADLAHPATPRPAPGLPGGLERLLSRLGRVVAMAVSFLRGAPRSL